MLKYGLYLTQRGNPFEEIIQVEGFLIIPGAQIVAVWLEYQGLKEVVSCETNPLTTEDLDGYLKQGLKRLKGRLELIKKMEEEFKKPN